VNFYLNISVKDKPFHLDELFIPASIPPILKRF